MSQVTCQLAHDIDIDTFKGVTFPLWGFTKIDGVRGAHVKGGLTGRSMDPFKNSALVAKFSDPVYAGFDGELTINGYLTNDELAQAIERGEIAPEDPNATLCSLTTGLTGRKSLRKGETALPDNAVWNLFDWLHPAVVHLTYEERYKLLDVHLVTRPVHHVRLLPYTVIENEEQALAFIDWCIANDFEGAVFRDPKAKHKSGRPGKKDNDFWRFKPTSDKDAFVIGIEEAMENQNEAKTNSLGRTERSSAKAGKVAKGMIGNLICRDFVTKKVIKVPAGKMKEDFKIAAFLNQTLIVGHPIKYTSLDTGVKDEPRQARFTALRSREDLLPHELFWAAEWEKEMVITVHKGAAVGVSTYAPAPEAA